MISFKSKPQSKTLDQEALLERRSFSLRPLSTNGSLDFLRVFQATWLPIAVFLFSLFVSCSEGLRYKNETLNAAILTVGLGGMLLLPTASLLVLLAGIASTSMHSRVRWSAALYWTWWPFWKLVLCTAASMVGYSVGNTLWYDQLYVHARLGQLQAYQFVDPVRVSGVRLQDAGIVTFNETAGVDRKKIGCLQNTATYCVAPIVHGGQVQSDDLVPHKRYDLFMAGVDCCSCPGEFRCGDWNSPARMGGLRVLDGRRDFFRLAAEDFAASHGKAIGHPVFFEWVADPLPAYHQMHSKGIELLWLAAVLGPACLLFAASLLNGALSVLCHFKWAAPLEAPLPPHGLARALSARLLPQLHRHQEKLEAQQRGMLAPGPTTYVTF